MKKMLDVISVKKMKGLCLLCTCVALSIGIATQAFSGEKYNLTHAEFYKYKGLDDPRPFLKDTNYYQVWMPAEEAAKLRFDVEAMKKLWSETVGFKAPEVVGKLHPEIKPGKYTLADKEKLPFKELMPAFYYEKWNQPGADGKNHGGNFTEFEIVPTQQYYYALPIAKATKKYEGTAKQDEQGYLIEDSYQAGLPFPRPSGPHRAMQMAYNWQLGYREGEQWVYLDDIYGMDKNWKHDFHSKGRAYIMRVRGRTLLPPYGILDKRTVKQKELRLWQYEAISPRDFYGNVYFLNTYLDKTKSSSLLAYVNILRRIRKLSSNDKQDQAIGQDLTFDDADGFTQTMSPNVYPMEYKVIGEREFLMPSYTPDCSEYYSTDKLMLKNLKMERRPVWVVEMTSLDKNYVYSKRIMYMDKETLLGLHFEMYDQKGRLYRNFSYIWGFEPEQGRFNGLYTVTLDHIDVHSTVGMLPAMQATWLKRRDISLRSMLKAK